MLEDEVHHREKLEEEISMLQNQLLQLSFDADEVQCHPKVNTHVYIFCFFFFAFLIANIYMFTNYRQENNWKLVMV